MSESSGESDRGEESPAELGAVAERLSELQRRKRGTVRWHMSRDTAERAIAAIIDGPHQRPTTGSKSRRRKRHKRLL
jgi:hypothetical protein